MCEEIVHRDVSATSLFVDSLSRSFIVIFAHFTQKTFC